MKYNLLRFLGTVTLVAVGIFSGISTHSQVIEVERQDATPLPANPQWRLTEKIQQARAMLNNIQLAVGTTDIRYFENRISRTAQGTLTTTRVPEADPERAIALVLMDKVTGELHLVNITKHGAQVLAPDGYSISVVQRSNGIAWNGFNTHFDPGDQYIVLANAWPIISRTSVPIKVKDRNGRIVTRSRTEQTVEPFVYSPYSQGIHLPELIELGSDHIALAASRAFAELSRVPSRAVPGKTIAEVWLPRRAYFELLPIIEQTDLTEFIPDPRHASERVLTLIGANVDKAYAKTGSPAGAYGWVQFTSGTWKEIRSKYPTALLPGDFKAGAADHVTSLKAAILLYDDNLKKLIGTYGDRIIDDPHVEEYLAASYNGGTKRIMDSLNAALARHASDWTDTSKLRSETKGYMVKIRTLRQMNFLQTAIPTAHPAS